MANQVFENALSNLFVAAGEFVSFTAQGLSRTAAIFLVVFSRTPGGHMSKF